MKLKQLTRNIKDDLPETMKASINIELHRRPTNLNFEHALASFRSIVNTKILHIWGQFALHVIKYKILIPEDDEDKIVTSVVGYMKFLGRGGQGYGKSHAEKVVVDNLPIKLNLE